MINPDYKSKSHQARVMARRRRKEARFRSYGLLALLLAASMLGALLYSIFSNGIQGLSKDYVVAEVTFDAAEIDPQGTNDYRLMSSYNFDNLIYPRFYEALGVKPTGRSDRDARRKIKQLIGAGASDALRTMLVTKTQDADGNIIFGPGPHALGDTVKVRVAAQSTRNNPYADQLRALGFIETGFNWEFFTGTNSNDPGSYGIRGALMGSFWLLVVCFLASFPLGVLAALYLEEFAPRNPVTDFIEININNLAAVPSIIFGLMGAFILVSVIGLEQQTALVGGLILSMLTLPTIIVAARASIKSVPHSFREAALGLGASKQQAMFHFILPYAMPGIITGTIIGLAGALGETAPLLFIGMIGFIDGVPATPLDPSPSLAVSIFNLFGSAFDEMKRQLSNATIIVLLVLLIAMNGSAALIRYYSEKKK